jgi:uncharacterized membrane protein
MIPDPLHPAIVHLPMALVVLLPLFTVGALLAIWRGAKPRGSWSVVLAMQLILSFSSWLAVETGEEDEDRYEHGPAEQMLESHEELAEGFTVYAWLALPLAALGLAAGRFGQIARIAYLGVAIGLLVVGSMLGHRGGKIVYPDGAQAPANQLIGDFNRRDHDDHDDHDDGDDDD